MGGTCGADKTRVAAAGAAAVVAAAGAAAAAAAAGNRGACSSFKVARGGAEAVKPGPPRAPCAARPPICSKGQLSGACPRPGPSAALVAEVAVAERGKVEAGVGGDREAQEQRCPLSAPPASGRRRRRRQT